MLLNRQRVKFWQKWIFGFMAFLMAAFLIFGYSGVLTSCMKSAGVATGSGYDQAVDKATTAYKAAPRDAAAILALAQAYQSRALSQVDASSGQKSDAQQALRYYDKYLALPAAKLGVNPRAARISALQAQVLMYTKLEQTSDLVRVYNKLIGIQPKNPEYYLQLGAAASDAGDTPTALLAFSRFLQLSPRSQYASQVKQRIKTLQAQLSSTTAPIPSATSSSK